ncbi:ATP-grasp domain-containing protein [Oceanobacillus luteolus]|uniref:ATP-grasp domain-containing protein n=1 Tax=Oceanobacillus luteolus TaxID=1274358 RepID=UPI002041D975|nr:ATP-grasp domain-containing protein [Oceanobacillus luteolus]MCM3741808.1 ATP-grasp domain-containing protein [Oceanobacillus luteolus]
MKKILIIGAGFLQSFIIKKAKEMDYYTFAIDKNPNSIGFKFADEYEVIDIVDQEACLQYAISKKVDGVITAATDYGVISAAYVAQEMNLPGLNYEVAKIVKNKYLVRRNLFENKVDDIKQYYEIANLTKLNKIKDNISYPVIVKPCDGSGSKAINKVNTFEELVLACNDAINASLEGKALIEDFIEGKEFGVESFVFNGQVHILGVMGKQMTDPPDYAELGHYMPSGLSIEEKIKRVVRNAIKSLGINFGSVNMDILVTNSNDICIIDVGARMGGNLIGSHIIPLSTGIDYMNIIIKAATGGTVEIEDPVTKVNVSTRLLALTPGKVIHLPDFNHIKKEFEVEIYHYLELGSEIKEYRNNLDGCGYIISVSKKLEDALFKTEKALRLVDKGIIRLVE